MAAFGFTTQEPPEPEVEWICPMDSGVRHKQPGKCPRCGMDLVAGLPDFAEYPLFVHCSPRAWRAGQRVQLRFEVLDPKSGKRVTKFVLIHEKLFHLFIVSEDLEDFAHEHPEPQADGSFLFQTVLPKAGAYRFLADYFPAGGTPQLAVQTLLSADHGRMAAAPGLSARTSSARGANLNVRLRCEPEPPIAGFKTRLFFELDPADRLEMYLGAWGHLLAASADLIDLIHTHPFLGDGGPVLQFNVVFPRAGAYRLWPQFQRAGVVNTLRFDLTVRDL